LMARTRMPMPCISRTVAVSDAAKAEDSAEPAREHAVLRELIELANLRNGSAHS